MSESWVRNRLLELGERVGIHLHPHRLRHTIATEMLERGADIRDAQEMLGHADPKTTAIYLKVRPARLRETVLRVNFSANAAAAEN